MKLRDVMFLWNPGDPEAFRAVTFPQPKKERVKNDAYPCSAGACFLHVREFDETEAKAYIGGELLSLKGS